MYFAPIGVPLAGSDSHFGLRRDISRVFGKIEQACSISKEVYVCCSKIVDSVFAAKGRGAQSVSIKKQELIYKVQI
ncbi:hypothetical protein VTHSUH11_05565 [Veillonella tobetsuensis]|uniref:Uncharacterized protein n=1 Tax=Veillonella tobetsuensis TaxID=1110546 RepID=A0A2S7ZQM6_9FIRM|nr:hypothetical protein VTHSUH11_05565 [Veillonella tobetsuensis]